MAVMRLPDRAGYHRVRTPHVTETDAAQLIDAYAGLRQTLHTLQVVSDDQAVERWPDDRPARQHRGLDETELVRVASRPGFHRWRAMVAGTGGCADPIHLVGQSP